jgi:hypothetical protein
VTATRESHTRPGTPVRRRLVRRCAVALGAVAVLVVATACNTPSNDPETYGAEVEENFVTGCTGDVGTIDGTTTTLAARSDCVCAYEVFVENVPFNDDARPQYAGYPGEAPTFTQLNADLASASDPGEVYRRLPQEILAKLTACYGGTPPPGPVAPQAP